MCRTLTLIALFCALFATTAQAARDPLASLLSDRTSQINAEGDDHLLLRAAGHPLVGQDADTTTDLRTNDTRPTSKAEWRVYNFTKNMRNFIAFNYGFEGDYFAANFSTATISLLQWWYFEVNTYRIKLKYASYNDAVTNTTQFIQNTTEVLITVTNVIENIYYYGLREAERFESATDWALGLLQSLLGSVLRITAITNDLV